MLGWWSISKCFPCQIVFVLMVLHVAQPPATRKRFPVISDAGRLWVPTSKGITWSSWPWLKDIWGDFWVRRFQLHHFHNSYIIPIITIIPIFTSIMTFFLAATYIFSVYCIVNVFNCFIVVHRPESLAWDGWL